jgi:hypothetical protein
MVWPPILILSLFNLAFNQAILLCMNTFACHKIIQYWTGISVSYSVKTKLNENKFLCQTICNIRLVDTLWSNLLLKSIYKTFKMFKNQYQNRECLQKLLKFQARRLGWKDLLVWLEERVEHKCLKWGVQDCQMKLDNVSREQISAINLNHYRILKTVRYVFCKNFFLRVLRKILEIILFMNVS